ncbi:GNAT family N-acetyltransferase [Chitinophagaceae bacterium MMS25-I14]
MLQEIQAPGLLLRPVAAGDLEDIHALHSLPETDEYNTLGIPADVGVTKQLLDMWLAALVADPQMKYVWSVLLRDTGKLVGLAGMNMGTPGYRSSEIWYKMHKDHWGKGYATEVAKGMIRFGFKELKLHRIEAGCVVENKGSIAVLEKAGMQREGHRRQKLPIRGQWVDNYEYAILEMDFTAGNK